MVRALVVSPSFLPGMGGIETYLSDLCSELADSGREVAVLAPAQRDGLPLPTDLGYPTIGFAGRMLVPSARVASAIAHAAESRATKRVIFGTPWPLVLVAPQLRKQGLRYAVMVHGAELVAPAAVPGLRRLLLRALQDADLLLTVSRYTAGRLRHMLGAASPPIDVLRPRVDIERFRPDVGGNDVKDELGLRPDHRVVLCLGRLVRRKGVHRLIDAWPEICRRVPDAVLVVGGVGPEEARLRRQAAGLPVVFAGRVPREDAPKLYAMADVFCLAVADRWFGLEIEGLGVVLLEASACATPCVTGRSGGTPEAVLDQQTGFVVDATDRAALAERVVALLDPSEPRRFGEAARRYVTREFAHRALPPRLIDWLA